MRHCAPHLGDHPRHRSEGRQIRPTGNPRNRAPDYRNLYGAQRRRGAVSSRLVDVRRPAWIIFAKEPVMGEGTRQDIGILDLVLYYLRLGALGFGGPVALCGQMERELVQERKWLTRDEMRDGIAVCQSLPGPLAIQVGIFVSYLRGGFWGAWAGGWAFILPNFIIVSALGALYVHFSGLPILTAIFYGVSPAVIALILHSCYRLAKLGMEDWLQWTIAGACFLITIALQAEVAVLFIASGLVGISYYGSLFRRRVAVEPTAVATAGAVNANVSRSLQLG